MKLRRKFIQKPRECAIYFGKNALFFSHSLGFAELASRQLKVYVFRRGALAPRFFFFERREKTAAVRETAPHGGKQKGEKA